MKKGMWIVIVVGMFFSTQSWALSDSFKKGVADLKAKVLLKNQKLSPQEMSSLWALYDQEAIALLDKSTNANDLNEAGRPQELMVTDKKDTEIEEIELGKSGLVFTSLDLSGKAWLAVLYNDMAGRPFNTFHVYKKKGSGFERVGAFEDASGPWDRDQIAATMFQVQVMSTSDKKGPQFTTIHTPLSHGGAKPNRSQIVWHLDGQLKPTFWVPEVDWHNENGKVVQGRGLGLPVE